MDSGQDHPTSWTTLRQRRYIAVLRYGHHSGTAAPFASGLEQAPHPLMMTSEDGNAPPMSAPASAAGIYASTADPATVPPPSRPQVLLQASIPATSEPTVMGSTTPAQVPLPPSFGTSDWKRALRTLRPCLVTPASKGRPHTPTIHFLPHPTALRLLRPS